MKFKSRVNSIVNKYLKWEEHCEENDISKDDDKEYGIWLKIASKEVAEEICDDLVALCEDNREMQNAIRQYFGIKVDNEEDLW